MALQLFGSLAPGTAISTADRAMLTALESPRQAQFREELAWHYYRGDMYRWVRAQHGVEATRERAGMALDLAPYFNPVKEIVDVDVAKVFASPVRGTDLQPAIDARLNALWSRSSFAGLTRKYVQAGAAQGTVYLHVLDGERARIVARRADELQVLRHPQTGTIIAAQYAADVFDPLGIEGDAARPGTPTMKLDSYRYRLVITPTVYATFKNDAPWPFSDNPRAADGRVFSSWRNVLGTVPVVEVLHQDDGAGCGVSAWEGIKETIDAANQIATFMANTVKQHIDPLIVVYGVKKADVEKTLANGQTSVWYIKLPEGGTPPKIELLEWRGNVADVTGFIQWVKDRLTDVTPELQLARVQEQANPSGYSVALQSARLVDHIGDLRATYHAGLVQADRLAMWAEDVHSGVFGDPFSAAYNADAAAEAYLDETQYVHAIGTGPLFPVDVAGEVDTSSKMLADQVIDREEYLMRAGYSQPRAREILARLDKEQEARAAREMGLGETELERAALLGG